MSSLRDELRPLAPVFTAARQALDQSRWRLGMDVDDLIADIVLAVARELSGPTTAVLDQLQTTQALADSWQQRAGQAEATVARVRRANEQMRGWCSPYDFAIRCADHIDEALEKPGETP